uniref:hypothetical protein n=1 Tax=Flavobacterium sp. TaxID=239 RepID=UPI0025C32987
MTINPVVTPSVTAVADKAIICPLDNVTFTATPTDGGTAPTYQWKNNGIAISGATDATYITTGTALGSPNSITVEMISNEACAPTTAVTSTAVVVTVNAVPTINVSIVSDVPAICANNPVVFTATVSGSGSTPAPTYEWFITSSTTTPGGTSQGTASTTATTFATSALTATNNKVYVQVVSNAACATATPISSNVVSITINAGITGGTIGSDQAICYNATMSGFTEITPSDAVTPGYVWEASPRGLSGSYVAIPGATNATYTPPAIPVTMDVYLHRIVTDGSAPGACNTATSNTVHVTVSPQLVAGIIGSDQTICSGQTPAAFTSAILPGGGTGSYTYQWQSDASGTMADITGATNATYTAGALTTTTKFQRVETSGTCGSVTSNVVTVNITTPVTLAVSINDPGQTCAGSAPFTFTATMLTGTGTGTLSYQWLKNNVVINGETNMTYIYSPALGDNGKSISVRVTTSNSCNTGPATSNVIVLNIVTAVTPTVTITTNDNPNCAGFPSTFTATATGTGTAPTYQWYVNGIAAGSG